MSTEMFYYQRNEVVRLGNVEGLFRVQATMGRASGNTYLKYYKLLGAVTGTQVLASDGSVWHKESTLKKAHAESFMTFPELMDVIKNDWINEEDIK